MNDLISFQKAVGFLKEEEVKKIKDCILENKIRIFRKETGMIMNTVSDPFGNPFHLGEILVCEAEVEYQNLTGYGIAVGNNEDHAVILASLETLMDAGNSEAVKEIKHLFKDAFHRYEESVKNEESFAMGTKVNFGLMTEG